MTGLNRDESHRLTVLMEAVSANVGLREGLRRSLPGDRPTLECIEAATFRHSLVVEPESTKSTKSAL